MVTRLTRLLIVALLCLVPLQGMAGALSSIMCDPAEHHETLGSDAAALPTHSHADGGGMPHGHTGDGAPDAEHSMHQCCHILVAGVPAPPASFSGIDLAVFETSLSLLSTLFVPEQPQRPPRI